MNSAASALVTPPNRPGATSIQIERRRSKLSGKVRAESGWRRLSASSSRWRWNCWRWADVINATGLNGVITADAKPNLIAMQPGPNSCQISQPTKPSSRSVNSARERQGPPTHHRIAYQQPPGFRSGSRSDRDRLNRLRGGQHQAIGAYPSTGGTEVATAGPGRAVVRQRKRPPCCPSGTKAADQRATFNKTPTMASGCRVVFKADAISLRDSQGQQGNDVHASPHW